MKLGVTIAGPKVHEVGYQIFLLKNATNTALPGLPVYNWEAGSKQEVIALAEGNEARMDTFLKAIQTKKPELDKDHAPKDLQMLC